MPPRVPRRVKAHQLGGPQLVMVAILELHIDARDAGGVGSWAHDGAATPLLQLGVAADVVIVVVGYFFLISWTPT